MSFLLHNTQHKKEIQKTHFSNISDLPDGRIQYYNMALKKAVNKI